MVSFGVVRGIVKWITDAFVNCWTVLLDHMLGGRRAVLSVLFRGVMLTYDVA